ncbi:vWA domain-containing protein [Comamonas fluminis]|uniref:vWA domain-containing protein n=1 Tax=Comamonas fluminis TaxID=2796366 RepID=UPI001FE6121F|nr:VWA domain-containing protein [Comamonas fluminis]
MPLAAEHLRWKRPQGKSRHQHLFLLDCSASMVESGAFAKAKGLLLQWMRWAYLRRESVALLCFGAGQVRWLLQPTRAPRWNDDLIESLLGGGGTPLAAALQAGWEMAAQHSAQPSCLWVISDFRSADVLQLELQPAPPLAQIWVDCDVGGTTTLTNFGGASRLASAWPLSVTLSFSI